MNRDDIDRLRGLIENQRLVEQLQYCLSNAPRDIDILRSTLAQALARHAWEERLDNRLAREVRFNAILDFITSKPLEGLGSSVETLRRLLAGTPELVDLEQALARGRGGNNNPEGRNQHAAEEEKGEEVNPSIRSIDQPALPAPAPIHHGTTVQYAIRRLSSQRPDLLERVKAGEMSANAAMIEAGFRKVPTVLDILRRAWAKASEEERAALIREHGEEVRRLLDG